MEGVGLLAGWEASEQEGDEKHEGDERKERHEFVSSLKDVGEGGPRGWGPLIGRAVGEGVCRKFGANHGANQVHRTSESAAHLKYVRRTALQTVQGC